MESLGPTLGRSTAQSREAALLTSFSHTPPSLREDPIDERDKQQGWLWSRTEEMLLPSAPAQVWYAREQVLTRGRSPAAAASPAWSSVSVPSLSRTCPAAPDPRQRSDHEVCPHRNIFLTASHDWGQTLEHHCSPRRGRRHLHPERPSYRISAWLLPQLPPPLTPAPAESDPLPHLTKRERNWSCDWFR